MRSSEIWRYGLVYPRFRATDYKEYPLQLQTCNAGSPAISGSVPYHQAVRQYQFGPGSKHIPGFPD